MLVLLVVVISATRTGGGNVKLGFSIGYVQFIGEVEVK